MSVDTAGTSAWKGSRNVAILDLSACPPRGTAMDAKHALTVLTRLAARRPTEVWKLEQALKGRLGALAVCALEVGTETGDPIGQAFDKLLREDQAPELAASLAGRIPKDTVALRELAATITEQALSAIESDPDLSACERMRKSALARLDLSFRLSSIGERRRAHEVTEATIIGLIETPELSEEQRDLILGRAYGELSTCLSDLGKHEDSLAAAKAS
jgi:hypothetical protein